MTSNIQRINHLTSKRNLPRPFWYLTEKHNKNIYCNNHLQFYLVWESEDFLEAATDDGSLNERIGNVLLFVCTKACLNAGLSLGKVNYCANKHNFWLLHWFLSTAHFCCHYCAFHTVVSVHFLCSSEKKIAPESKMHAAVGQLLLICDHRFAWNSTEFHHATIIAHNKKRNKSQKIL